MFAIECAVVCEVHVSSPHLSVMQSQTPNADVLPQSVKTQFLKLKAGVFGNRTAGTYVRSFAPIVVILFRDDLVVVDLANRRC